jgi:hypothetical protein
MLFEYSITSYWVGEFDAALAACDRLLARTDLPDLHREQTRRNHTICAEAVARRVADAHVREITLDPDRTSMTSARPRGAGDHFTT